MKAYLWVLMLPLLMAGCTEETKAIDQPAKPQITIEWAMLKSPLTGYCYEVATRKENSATPPVVESIGMAKVECR